MNLPSKQLEALLKQAEVFEPGQCLVMQGQASRELLLLVRGRVEVVRDDQVIGLETEQGAFMGVLALFSGGTRHATLRAQTRTHAVRIPPSKVLSLVESTPSLALKLLERISRMFSAEAQRGAAAMREVDMDREAVSALLGLYLPALTLLVVDGAPTEVLATTLEGFTKAFEALNLLPARLVVGRTGGRWRGLGGR